MLAYKGEIIMEPVIVILLFIVGIPITICALIALFAALMLLLPDPIRQARTNLEEHPWRSIFLGILNFTGAAIILALLITLVSNNMDLQPILNPLIVLVAMALAIPMVIGLCAVIILVGTRLGEARRPLWTYLRGGGLLLLACVVPFIGWFVFAPLMLWAGMGSVIGILVRPKTPKVLEALPSADSRGR
jgi:hypothetical protein